MFSFKIEPQISLLTVARSGLWTLGTVAAYEAALRRNLAELHKTGPRTSVIIDIRSIDAQPTAVADALRAMVGRLGPLLADRTAIVTSSGIAKLQAVRVEDADSRVFTSIVLARDWVLHRNELPSSAIVYDEPSYAETKGRTVHILGPSDVDVNLTPAAALKTAKRIEDAATAALLGPHPDAPDRLQRAPVAGYR